MSGPGELEAVAAAHVDDNGISAEKPWLDHTFGAFFKRFGAATRGQLPMVHTGIRYSDTPRGRRIDQDEFCQKLQPVEIESIRRRKPTDPLTKAVKGHDLEASAKLCVHCIWV